MLYVLPMILLLNEYSLTVTQKKVIILQIVRRFDAGSCL